MAWLQFPAEGGVKSSIAKFFSDENIEAIKKLLKLKQVTCCSSLPINRL